MAAETAVCVQGTVMVGWRMVVGSQLVCISFAVGFSEQVYLNRIRPDDDVVDMLLDQIALVRECRWITIASLVR